MPVVQYKERGTFEVWATFGMSMDGQRPGKPRWTHAPRGLIRLVSSGVVVETPIGPTWACSCPRSPGGSVIVRGGYVTVSAIGPGAREVASLLRASCGAVFTVTNQLGRKDMAAIPAGVIPHVEESETHAEGVLHMKPVYVFDRAMVSTAATEWALDLVIHEPALGHILARGYSPEDAIAIQAFVGGSVVYDEPALDPS